jgi:ABC-type phosphate/phosphonate transport system substrate-binding protein
MTQRIIHAREITMQFLDNFTVSPRRPGWRCLPLLGLSLALAACNDANSTARTPASTQQSGAEYRDSQTSAKDSETLIFSAPPRESTEESARIYRPVAEHLGEVLGKQVVYQHPGSWGIYRSRMLASGYDLVFDGPHFNSFRAEKLGHTVLVKADGAFELALIVRENHHFVSVQRMAGRTFCTHAPPNLGALVLLDLFDNPARQPAIVTRDSWEAIYWGVVDGRCAGGMIPVAQWEKLNRDGNTRIVYKTPPLPNQAFSAGPRLSPGDREKVIHALLSAQGNNALDGLRVAHKISGFAPATNEQYRGLSAYLRNEWGFYYGGAVADASSRSSPRRVSIQ